MWQHELFTGKLTKVFMITYKHERDKLGMDR